MKKLILLLILIAIVFGSDETRFMPMNVSIWYPLATNSSKYDEVLFNLGIGGSNYGALHGLDITSIYSRINGDIGGVAIAGIGLAIDGDMSGFACSGLATINGSDALGFSVGGLFTVSGGDITGASVAGLASICGSSLQGISTSGLFNIVGDSAEGAQLGGLFAISGDEFDGMQTSGLFALNGGEFHGMQASGGFAISGNDFYGVQTAGCFTITGGKFKGFQASCVNFAGDGLKGMQAGVVNLSGNDMRGFQAGIANITGESYGFQAGVVNIAGIQHGLPLGIVNLSSNGDFEFLTYSSNLTGINIATKFTSNNWYSEVFLGYMNFEKDINKSLSWGGYFGRHFPINKRMYIDFDGGYLWLDNDKIFDENGFQKGLDQRAVSLRGKYGIRINNKFSLFAGGGMNYVIYAENRGNVVYDWHWDIKDGKYRPYIFGGISMF